MYVTPLVNSIPVNSMDPKQPTDLPTIQSPLTEDHYRQIVAAINYLRSITPEMDRAQMAGIDMAQHRLEHKANLDKLMALKNVYFPGR